MCERGGVSNNILIRNFKSSMFTELGGDNDKDSVQYTEFVFISPRNCRTDFAYHNRWVFLRI